ncbi:hypothetical protein JTB14_018790 [Gonioctena quinquepunctata]|nr:hypothetical protein JTB14_018790 [Gonioctena quinquepunctata]
MGGTEDAEYFMSRPRNGVGSGPSGGPSLGDLLTARPSGLVEPESWAILCQAVQALQDLFLSGKCSVILRRFRRSITSYRGRFEYLD